MKNNDTKVTEKIQTGDLTNDCTRVSVCLARWLKEERDIDCKIHLGIIASKDGIYLTPHTWLSIDGKLTDITSMKQKDDTVQCIIHGKAIGKKGNGERRISGHTLSKKQLDDFQKEPEAMYSGNNIVSALNALVKYKDTCVMPYDKGSSISLLDKVNYDDFFNNYPIPNIFLGMKKKVA